MLGLSSYTCQTLWLWWKADCLTLFYSYVKRSLECFKSVCSWVWQVWVKHKPYSQHFVNFVLLEGIKNEQIIWVPFGNWGKTGILVYAKQQHPIIICLSACFTSHRFLIKSVVYQRPMFVHEACPRGHVMSLGTSIRPTSTHQMAIK